MTFLAIDIGNTRLKWAQYDAPQPGARLIAHGAEFLENIDKLADGTWIGVSCQNTDIALAADTNVSRAGTLTPTRYIKGPAPADVAAAEWVDD